MKLKKSVKGDLQFSLKYHKCNLRISVKVFVNMRVDDIRNKLIITGKYFTSLIIKISL